MAFDIQQTDIDKWNGFFNDSVVNVKPPVATHSSTDGSLQNVSCINDQFGGISFESKQNNAQLGQSQIQIEKSIVMTLISNDKSTASNITLQDVFSKAGYSQQQQQQQQLKSSSVPNLFTKVVSALAKDIKFTIDQSISQSNPRNMMWLTPGNTLRLDTALTLKPANPDPATTLVLDDLNIKAVSLSSISLVVHRTCEGIQMTTRTSASSPPVTAWHIRASWRLCFRIPVPGFLFWVSLDPSGMSVSVTADPSLDAAQSWSRMKNLGLMNNADDAAPTDGSSGASATDILSDTFQFLQLRLMLDAQGGINWNASIMISLPNENKTVQDTVDLYLTYDSLSKTFSGGLITAGFFTTAADRLLPDYYPGVRIDQPGSVVYPEFWDLKQYFSRANQDAIPKALPLAVKYMNASLAFGTSKTVTLSGATSHGSKQTADGTPTGPTVTTPFVWDSLDVYFSATRNAAKTSIVCKLSTWFTLNPKTGSKYEPAALGILMNYDSGSWVLSGHADNLSCGLLYSFFDVDSQSGMMDIIGGLTIRSLDLILTHSSTGGPASFLFTGVIDLGELQMRLFFQHTSSSVVNNAPIEQALTTAGGPTPLRATAAQQTAWVFECDLGASTGNATIGSIVNSILNDPSISLPPFIANIKIPSADGSKGRAPVFLKATKKETSILFAFRFSLGPFTVTFVQVAATGPADPNKPTKRLIRFSVDKIPTLGNIPLLDSLPQPFDHMDYMFVNQAGFNKADVDAINSNLLPASDAIMYKDTANTDATTKDDPTASDPTSKRPAPNSSPQVLAPGHHFLVVVHGAIVVDHVFNASPAPAKPVQGQPQPTNPPAPPSTPSKGAMVPKPGPLSINGLGLQFKEEGGSRALVITMDATFAMGPISFSLLGFGIHIGLEGVTLDDLSALLRNITVTLAGMSLAFNKPPLLIAGGFEHAVLPVPGTSGATQEIFMGGIGVSFPPYTFVGLGEYAIVTVHNEEYKSVFLFCKLNGPLVELEFATISGVRLGLGYNSFVRTPDLSELNNFPFINDNSINGGGNDPMAILKNMTGGPNPWVVPTNKSYWFAAGMSISAFEIVEVTAVALLEFQAAGLIVNLYADAIAKMPPEAPAEAVIVYAEITAHAEANFIEGYLLAQASIAPTSYLLVPQCHLYGSFALQYWFAPSDHAGDWVFTIGGYHPSYTPPQWYPKPRTRLGISFRVDIITITGEAYFAITPKCVMGGALLHARLRWGPLCAWLDASFDALIQFHPLHYWLDFRVDVGVNFTIDDNFVDTPCSIHVGATLHIEGPEFGGKAHVEVCLISFDVNFGASPQEPPALSLLEFFKFLHKPGPESSDNSKQHDAQLQSCLAYSINSSMFPFINQSGTDFAPGAAMKYSLVAGNALQPVKPDTSSTGGPPSTGAGTGWFVKGGSFAFRVSTDFAVKTASLQSNHLTSSSNIYSKPMHVGVGGEIKSMLAITVVRKILNQPDEAIDNFSNWQLVMKPVPIAVWGNYDPATDPRTKPASLLDGNGPTVDQAMGVDFGPPLPTLSPPISFDGHNLVIPKFKATAAMKFGILDFRSTVQKDGVFGDTANGTDWFVPASMSQQTKDIPRARTDAENKADNATRWKNTKTYWQALSSLDSLLKGTGAGDGLLAMVGQTLAWDQGRPQDEVVSTTGNKPWELVGSLPTKMIANLEQTYLDLPRVAVA